MEGRRFIRVERCDRGWLRRRIPDRDMRVGSLEPAMCVFARYVLSLGGTSQTLRLPVQASPQVL